MSIPFVKSFDFEYGSPTQISPLVRRIICENPGPFTYTGSGTYLIGTTKVAAIDPGPVNKAHLEALLRIHKQTPITHIFVTHTHKDHCGGVADLKKATGAIVYGYGAHPSDQGTAAPLLDEGSDFSYRPDLELKHGDEVQTDEWHLTAIHTPGHISNHLCFHLKQENALFTGDHIMGWATSVVAAPDGNMQDYYDSLDLLISREDAVYYPTHGAPIKNPQKFTRAVKIHRQMRDTQIIKQLENGITQIMPMVERMYTDVDPRLHFAAALNVQAHLERQVDLGKVIKIDESLTEASYQLSTPHRFAG